MFIKSLLVGSGLMGTLCFAGTPDDFFIKALREKAGVEVTNLHLSASAEVKEKRGEQYFTNLAHGVTGNDNRDQVEYWTVQFSVDRNGIPEAEQCRGILRRQAQMTDQQRDVTLDQCERDFRPDMHNGLAVNNQQVELP